MTTTSAWAIRFYVPIRGDSAGFIGSFEGYGHRALDEIVTFSGMYGINDYMLWYTHDDLDEYDFDTFGINLRLFLHGNPRSPYFDENYRVSNVWYDEKQNKYVVFAIQELHAKLDTLLIEYGVTSLSYNEKRDAEQVLTDVLEENGIFAVQFHDHDNPSYKARKFEYKRIAIKPSWTVRDFIEYIAGENDFEWCLKYGALQIGPELKALEQLNATGPEEVTTNHISSSALTRKQTTEASPIDVLYHANGLERCIWVKHTVGTNGDITRACFTHIGRGRFDLKEYVKQLEGGLEKTMGMEAVSRMESSFSINFKSVTVGKIKEDSGEDSYIDEVSIQKNLANMEIKDPKDVVIDVDEPLYMLEKLSRTTPYLEDGAGLQFPSPVTPANSIMLLPEGRVESAVVGPYVFGNGEEDFEIPFKNQKDFRLHLLNGWCLYVKENGEMVIQQDASSDAEPDKSGTYISFESDGSINIDNAGTINIGENASAINIAGGAKALAHAQHTHTETMNHTHSVVGVMAGPAAIATGPAIGTDTINACTDNTTKTKAD